jgi:acetolactate synthase I/II/III large subunit
VSNLVTVGHVVATFLERCGVRTAFGVISIHNMPVLDAMAQRGTITFVSARGEAGAASMADACARTTQSLGVVVTSTGTAAGNAAGGLVEALTAGTPLLHITGQIDSAYLDQDLAYIHEAPDQLAMLKAVSKQAFRVRSASTALATFKQAVHVAMSAPCGPVSVEVPIDIQAQRIDMPLDLEPLPVQAVEPDARAVAAMAHALARAKRPLLWLGGGARGAGAAVARLMAMGMGVVTSVQGRGVVREDHPLSLGAYNVQPDIERFYASCDAMLVVGSRLRGNETLQYKLKLPQPLLRVDANPLAQGRGYSSTHFVCGDAALTLDALANHLEGRMTIDPAFAADLRTAHAQAVARLRDGLGPYAALVDGVQAQAGARFNWVRDVTLSNSTWGNRELRLFDPQAGVHALGGGIGLGLPMAIGAALGAHVHATGKKTLLLVGDGGFALNLGELACAVQERASFLVVLMNDRGYGVIKNIQDVQYGGRRVYVDLHTPDYAMLAQSMGFAHRRLSRMADLSTHLAALTGHDGVVMLEVDMKAIGDFKTAFAGPPVKA